MDPPPAMPAIPPRTRNVDSRKRHTLAADYRARATKSYHQASKRGTLQPGSTEVISSLISSLSTISTPAEDLFEKLLPELPATPIIASPLVGTFPKPPNSPATTANGTASYAPGPYGEEALHPDDAALPPIIRTAKPPSGYSPVTAPKRKSMPALSRSSPNLIRDASSQTIIPVPQLQKGANPSTDQLSTRSVGSNRSKDRSVTMKSSKEKMRDLDRERRRKDKQAIRGERRAVSADVENQRPSQPRRSFSDETVPTTSRRSQQQQDWKDLPELPGEDLSNRATTSGPGGIGSGRGIPIRESSLKQSKRRSRRSYGPTHVPSEIHVEQPDENEDTPTKEFGEVATHVEGEDQAKKRIQQLKELKQRREAALNDEHKLEAAKEQEVRRRVSKGRASLPAPSTRQGTDQSMSDSNTKRRRASEQSFHSTREYMSPPPEQKVAQQHHRTPSNPTSVGRRSFSNIHDGRPSTDDSISDAIAEYLTAPRLTQKIYHPQTGRAITFSDVGDPDGSVVFCCVGMGTTRYITAFYDELAATLKLRLITLDRPGVGESEPYRNGPEPPLAWPDDIRAVCAHLGVSRFSILAHSAGAIYALATALRMPRHIRGRIHLLAPWIPPSQMQSASINQEPAPVTSLPMSQRFLRSLPTPFLKAANSNFLSITSASIATSMQKSPKKVSSKRKSLTDAGGDALRRSHSVAQRGLSVNTNVPSASAGPGVLTPDSDVEHALSASLVGQLDVERQAEYDARLTQGIWEAATTAANPAVDLLVCLERNHDIGYRYVDVNKAVVIHHGAHDSRVPVDNVRWLGGVMRACEVRVLPDEGHGLMANPVIMGEVLTEIAGEWDDWLAVTRSGKQIAQRSAP